MLHMGVSDTPTWSRISNQNDGARPLVIRKENGMATLVAIGYPDQTTAEQARGTVAQLESELIIQADRNITTRS